MKKYLAGALALVLLVGLCACGSAAGGGKTVTVTFSTGETYEATTGEDFVFFWACDAPGDMGQPADGEEGAGITTSDGTVTYSNVGTGGPFSYPTSELVTVSGFSGDFTLTVCEEATAQDATHTIYTNPDEIEAAIAQEAAMAAARMSASGDAPAPM